jgi:hypothetical protein
MRWEVRLVTLSTARKAMDSEAQHPVVVSGGICLFVCLFFIYSGTPVHGMVPVTSKERVLNTYLPLWKHLHKLTKRCLLGDSKPVTLQENLTFQGLLEIVTFFWSFMSQSWHT